MAKIEAPVKVDGEVTGVGGLTFVDGVADTDNPAIIAYCQGAGYTVNGKVLNPPPDPGERFDARDAANQTVGTVLRDAAVDPGPEDFLPPTNAGQADPHGPEVVAPGIHAVSGPGPIVPGPVGRFEEETDDDGNVTSRVVISDTEEQQSRETTAAERVFLNQESVPEVTVSLGEEVGQPAPDTAAVGTGSVLRPAGNASHEKWAEYAVSQGMTEDEAAGLSRDELRDRYPA